MKETWICAHCAHEHDKKPRTHCKHCPWWVCTGCGYSNGYDGAGKKNAVKVS